LTGDTEVENEEFQVDVGITFQDVQILRAALLAKIQSNKSSFTDQYITRHAQLWMKLDKAYQVLSRAPGALAKDEVTE
jgi:hypothetical protein